MLPLLFACSGPGASDAMAKASLVGGVTLLIMALATAALVRALWRKRSPLTIFGAIVAVLLIPLHPTFTLGVTRGDCGNALLVLGPIVTLVHGLATGFVIWRARATAGNASPL